MRVLGIDPGAVQLGWCVIERGAWLAGGTLRGATGTAKDWALLARTARNLGGQVAEVAADHGVHLVAIETMVDQARERRVWANRHVTAAVCQGLYDALAASQMGTLVRWQDAADVLNARIGYGGLHQALRTGRAGRRPGAPGPLNEHEASACCHALWAEAQAHAPGAGGAGR